MECTAKRLHVVAFPKRNRSALWQIFKEWNLKGPSVQEKASRRCWESHFKRFSQYFLKPP